MDSAFIGTDGGSSNVNGGIASERQQAALATKCKSIIYLYARRPIVERRFCVYK